MTQSLSNNSSRRHYIDALRAFAILLVLYGHLVPNFTTYFVFTSAVKIPLFFSITGYVFNRQRTNPRQFIHNLVIKLIVPWLCLALLPVLLQTPKYGYIYLVTKISDMLSGKIVWYMPCCIIAEVFHFTVIRVSRDDPRTITILSLVCMLVGHYLCREGFVSYAMANRALFAQGFILLGMLIRKYEYYLYKISKLQLFFLWICYFALCFSAMIVYPGECMDVHLHRYYNLPMCLVMIVIGCAAAFISFERITRFPSSILFIGCNTIVYYIWGSYASRIVGKAMAFFGLTLKGDAFMALVGLVPICILCGFSASILDKTAPFMLGRRMHKLEV